jgi:hypothetical protein
MSDIDGDEGLPAQPAVKHRVSVARPASANADNTPTPLTPVSVTEGRCVVFFIVAWSTGLLANTYPLNVTDEELFSDGKRRVVGIVLGRWTFISPAQYRNTQDPSVLALGRASLSGRRGEFGGFLAYQVLERVEMNEPLEISAGISSSELLSMLRASVVCMNDRGTFFGHKPFAEYLGCWQSDYGDPNFPLHIVWLCVVTR